MFLNPLSVWMTVNPIDLHDLMAQVFAGEAINMDKFTNLMGSYAKRCAQNIAKDPYAAVKFFNFIIKTMLCTIFGVKDHLHSHMGVLGNSVGIMVL